MQKRSVRALGMLLGLTFGMLSAGVVTGGTFRVFSMQEASIADIHAAMQACRRSQPGSCRLDSSFWARPGASRS